MDVELEIAWNDPRLEWPTKCMHEIHKNEFEIDEEYWEYLWQPHTQIENANAILMADTLRSAKYLKISKVCFASFYFYTFNWFYIWQDGGIRKGGRFKINNVCDMDFVDYPFDDHMCDFAIRLGNWPLINYWTLVNCLHYDIFDSVETTNELILKWEKDVLQTTDLNNIRLPNFKVELFNGYEYNATNQNSLGTIYIW